jgi:hypothetical protein
MKLDITFWRAANMPVVIDGVFGFAADEYVAGSRIKTYRWMRLGPWGIEVFTARPAVEQTIGVSRDNRGEPTIAGAAPPA